MQPPRAWLIRPAPLRRRRPRCVSLKRRRRVWHSQPWRVRLMGPNRLYRRRSHRVGGKPQLRLCRTHRWPECRKRRRRCHPGTPRPARAKHPRRLCRKVLHNESSTLTRRRCLRRRRRVHRQRLCHKRPCGRWTKGSNRVRSKPLRGERSKHPTRQRHEGLLRASPCRLRQVFARRPSRTSRHLKASPLRGRSGMITSVLTRDHPQSPSFKKARLCRSLWPLSCCWG